MFPLIEETSACLESKKVKRTAARFGSLLAKIVDFSTRPYCYDIEHIETSEERVVYKVTKCPFAELARKMGCSELASHMCPRSHEAYAKAFGYAFSLKKFMLRGDECCLQIWRKAECGCPFDRWPLTQRTKP